MRGQIIRKQLKLLKFVFMDLQKSLDSLFKMLDEASKQLPLDERKDVIQLKRMIKKNDLEGVKEMNEKLKLKYGNSSN